MNMLEDICAILLQNPVQPQRYFHLVLMRFSPFAAHLDRFHRHIHSQPSQAKPSNVSNLNQWLQHFSLSLSRRVCVRERYNIFDSMRWTLIWIQMKSFCESKIKIYGTHIEIKIHSRLKTKNDSNFFELFRRNLCEMLAKNKSDDDARRKTEQKERRQSENRAQNSTIEYHNFKSFYYTNNISILIFIR